MKKKGSALILSLLMLSFFMTITLTMYYVAKNRGKRSLYKVKGLKIDSGLDSGSAIAHYELYLADRYISLGYPYKPATTSYGAYEVDIYTTSPAITSRYTTEVTSGSEIIVVPITGKHYTGIVLNNYNEYFAARWDSAAGSPMKLDSSSLITEEQAIQPWIAEDKIVGGNLVGRAWLNNTGEKIIRLWTATTGSAISVGGYRLIDVNGTYISDGSDAAAPIDVGKLDPTLESELTFTYEKIVSLNKTKIGSTGTENYRITYEELVNLTSSGSSIKIQSDQLHSMIVEKLK